MVINQIRPFVMRFFIVFTFVFLVACGAGQGQGYRIHIDRPMQSVPDVPSIEQKNTVIKRKMSDGAILPTAQYAETMLRAIVSPDPSQSVPIDLQDVYNEFHALPSELKIALYNIYMAQDFNPLWIKNGRVTKKTITFRTIIDREIYLSTPYKALNVDTLRGNKQTDFVRYDLSFTMALIKKIQIIKNGLTHIDGLYGITEGTMAHNIDWYRIFDAINNRQIKSFKRFMRPNHPFYTALLSEMEQVEKFSATNSSRLSTEHTLKPSMSGRDVNILIQKLKLRGYLHQHHQTGLYDKDVKKAVKAFQESQGAFADGIAGQQTLEMLNRTRADYIKTLLVNFERIRKAPLLETDTQIRVNVPEYRARYYEHNVETMDMAVIVGREERATPIFYDKMSYIEFNPFWNVPHRLAVEDILPKLQRDPSYLYKKNFAVYRGSRRISANNINWNMLDKDNFKYRFQQQPGPKNALGTVKFMFPNKYAVYLHDTPAKSLFHRINRSKSSGCIRVSDPVTDAVKYSNAISTYG